MDEIKDDKDKKDKEQEKGGEMPEWAKKLMERMDSLTQSLKKPEESEGEPTKVTIPKVPEPEPEPEEEPEQEPEKPKKKTFLDYLF